jgi:predicted NAD/FAD-dependent oxidoreductase
LVIIDAGFAGIAAPHALRRADAVVASIDLRDHRIVPSAVK